MSLPKARPGRRRGPITVIGTIGRLTHAKNPSLFNSIAERLIEKPNIKFLWIGSGELKGELTSVNIEATGWIPKAELGNLLGDIDIFISTSLWEGMPLTVLMAMNHAKPLVLSNCPGNTDLVDGNGFLFNTTEEATRHIEELVNDRALMARMGSESRDMAEKRFSLEKMVAGYNALYRNVANGKSLCKAEKRRGVSGII